MRKSTSLLDLTLASPALGVLLLAALGLACSSKSDTAADASHGNDGAGNDVAGDTTAGDSMMSMDLVVEEPPSCVSGPNELGVGKPCTMGGSECAANMTATICTCSPFPVGAPTVPCVCTIGGFGMGCPPAQDCGTGAKCCSFSAGGVASWGCQPTSCLPAGKCPS